MDLEGCYSLKNFNTPSYLCILGSSKGQDEEGQSMGENYICAKLMKLGMVGEIARWADELCHFLLAFSTERTVFQRLSLVSGLCFLLRRTENYWTDIRPKVRNKASLPKLTWNYLPTP